MESTIKNHNGAMVVIPKSMDVEDTYPQEFKRYVADNKDGYTFGTMAFVSGFYLSKIESIDTDSFSELKNWTEENMHINRMMDRIQGLAGQFFAAGADLVVIKKEIDGKQVYGVCKAVFN
jgi:hypothetical protein